MLLYLLLAGFLGALSVAFYAWERHAAALHQITLLQQDIAFLQQQRQAVTQQTPLPMCEVAPPEPPRIVHFWQQSLQPLTRKIAKTNEIAHRTTGQSVRLQTCLQYARKGVQQLDKSFLMGQKIMQNMVQEAAALDPTTPLAKNVLHIEAMMAMQAEYVKMMTSVLEELEHQSGQICFLLHQLADAASHHQRALEQMVEVPAPNTVLSLKLHTDV